MKEQKGKRWIFIAIIGVAVLAVAFSGWRNLRKGIFLANDFFYRVDDSLYQNDSINYIRTAPKDGGVGFTILLNGKEQSATLPKKGDLASIIYDDGTVIEGVWNGQWFTDPETGLPMEFGEVTITVTAGDESFLTPQPGKPAISNALCRIAWSDLEQRGNIALLFIGGILYALGAVSFLFPNEAHFFLRGWAYKKAELSESGIFMEKIGGILAMAVGALVMTGLFIV